jgi:hypothetical protein
VAGLLSKTDAVRKLYHFWPGEQRHDAWDVDRLVRMSAGFPVTQIALDSIEEVDSVYWFNDELVPTVRRIDAVRFESHPEPDYRNCRPEELPY